MQQKKPRKPSPWVPIGVFFLSFVVIAAGAVYFFYRRDADALRTTVGGLLLLGIFGTASLALWWRNRSNFFHRLYDLDDREYYKLSSKYAMVTRHANAIIFIADQDKKIVEANDRALDVYGYTREELIGMPVRLLRPAAARGDLDRQFARAKDEDGARFETLAMRKDGTVFPIESSVRVLQINGREHYIKIVQDITERKRAEAALADARREWEEIFQAVGNPAFILTPDNGVVSVNRAMQQALGMTEEEIVGKKCYELLHGSDHPPEQCPLGKMIASNQPETSEMEVETLGGTFLVTCTPMFADAGRLTKAIHIATDVTNLKQAYRQAEENRQRFSALARTAQDAIVVTDSDGTIAFWNPAAELMFGLSAAEVVGKSCEIYMPDDVREQYRRGLAVVRTTGRLKFEGKKYTSTALRKDGTTFSVEVSTGSWQEQGKTFFASFVRDISERTAAEQKIRNQLSELRQWQKMTLGREERMVELKKEVNELCLRLGEQPRYPQVREDGKAKY